MQFQMIGRIDSSEQYNGKTMTIITTPAPDSYSQPSSFKVRSDSPLGHTGAEVCLDISVSGFIRRKPYIDKNTNQNKVFMEDNVFFDASLAVKHAKAG